jgi:hypothetical protein
MAGRNGAARRWSLVVGAVVVLVSLPLVVAVWPIADTDRSAAELRAAVLASDGVGFTGYAQSTGGLSLPVTDQLSSVADLFSDRTTMRVWWRGPAENRVDVVTVGGETDVYSEATGSWRWEYEPNRATWTPVSGLSVPAPLDLLPTTLGRRLLSEAEPGELSRIGAQRVAGREVLGIRIVPAFPASSIGSVDVWVDAASGLPLQVRVVGKDGGTPAVDTRFLDVDLTAPTAEVTSFTPPSRARIQLAGDADVVANAGQQLSRIAFPTTLAGLPRRTVSGAPETVGLYGRGITLLAVVPLSRRTGRDLRQAAENDPAAVADELGTRLTAGPLAILLLAPTGRTSYLLTGTVTLDALAQAARELPAPSG